MGNSPSEEDGSNRSTDPQHKRMTNNEDKKEVNTQEKQETCIDIAFVLDCTGSMGSYIESCKDNINKIATTINKETDNRYDTQFGLVLYRDIPPEDTTFITKRIDFTPIPLKIQLQLKSIRASGGGDRPEALTSALYDCYKNLKWRQQSVKVIIVITDAPPHGLEKHIRDAFPNGDIDTFNEKQTVEGVNDANNKNIETYLNVIDIVKSIRDDLAASIYTVACEPSLSCDNEFANDFMQYMAEYTDGKFLPLSSASLLPSVIIGSIQQQINLDNLSNQLEEEIIKIKKEYGEDIDNAKLNELIAAKWKNEGIERKEISVSDVYKNKRSRENVDLLMNEQIVKSLDDFKKKCTLIPKMQRSDFMRCKVPVDSTVDAESKTARARTSATTTRNKSVIQRAFSNFSSLWKNNELNSVQKDLDAAVAEDLDFSGFATDLDIGDVKFNPLTGFQPGMNRPVDIFASELDMRQKEMVVMADVHADIFQVRQDYGQVAHSHRECDEMEQKVSMKSQMTSADIDRIRSYGNRRGKDY